MHRVGRHVETAFGGERVRAYVPPPLPPDPPLDVGSLQRALDHANQALGRLDGAGLILPNPQLFVFFAVRREALLSSQIEGTQSSLSDLLLFEAEGAADDPSKDVMDVSNYVAAMDHGLARLRGGFPLSLRLLREIHAVLLRNGRGQDKDPGEFRRTQNWIGGTRPGNAMFVPPPPIEMLHSLGQLEHFLHDERLPLLVRVALAHAQFETIHPFLDGNGRLGRLLITLMLCESGALREPLLYLSLYLKQNRQHYYTLLQATRDEDAWGDWVAFFLEGVTAVGEAEFATILRVLDLFAKTRDTVSGIGRPAASALRVLTHLERSPITTIASASAALDLTIPTISAMLTRLVDLGIVKELTGRARGRAFAFDAYVALLSEGAEPLPPGGP